MYQIGRKMEKPLKHSLGKNWKKISQKNLHLKFIKVYKMPFISTK